MDKNSAVYLINEGSLVLPRIGTGVKKGLSVSNKSRFNDMFFTVSLKIYAFLKVIIPDKEIKYSFSIQKFKNFFEPVKQWKTIFKLYF